MHWSFHAIGHKPITAFLDNQIETDDSGYIVPKEHTMTSIPGVFAAGDVGIQDTDKRLLPRVWVVKPLSMLSDG